MASCLRNPLLLVLLTASAPRAQSVAAPRSLTQLLPETAVATARSQGLWAAVTAAWPGWAWSRLPWRDLLARWDGPGAAGLAKATAALQLVGTRERELLADLLAGEVAAAALPDGGRPGLLVLARTRHAEALVDAARTLARLAGATVQDAPRDADLAVAWRSGAALRVRDGLLVVATSATLADAALWRWQSGTFVAQAPLPLPAPLALRLDLAQARALGGGTIGPAQAPLDVGGLLLALPAVATLRAASHLELHLGVDARGVAVTLRAPLALTGLDPDQRALLLADDFVPALVPELPGEVAAVSVRSSLPVLLARRRTLLREADRPGAEQALSVFALLFAGHPLEAQVLPALRGGLHLVLGREDWDAMPAAPPLRLPTAALVLGLRTPQLERAFHAAFENAVRFGEGDRRRQGKLVFAVERDAVADVLLTTARPRRPADRRDLPLDAGLTPTLTAAGGRVVLASSETLAGQLVTAMAASPVAATPAATDLVATLRVAGAGVVQALADARAALVAQRLLDTGAPRAEVESGLDALQQVVTGVRTLRGELCSDAAQGLTLRLALALQEIAR